jgi:hypothetical protein
MSELSKVIGAILADIARGRAMADEFSAQLSEQYANDKILQYFPVPRVDIRSIDLEIKFAFEGKQIEPNNVEVIMESHRLMEIDPKAISNMKLNLGISNYAWVKSDFETDEKKLIETSQ